MDGGVMGLKPGVILGDVVNRNPELFLNHISEVDTHHHGFRATVRKVDQIDAEVRQVGIEFCAAVRPVVVGDEVVVCAA